MILRGGFPFPGRRELPIAMIVARLAVWTMVPDACARFRNRPPLTGADGRNHLLRLTHQVLLQARRDWAYRALLIALFAFVVTLDEVLAWLKRKVDYYAAARHQYD